MTSKGVNSSTISKNSTDSSSEGDEGLNSENKTVITVHRINNNNNSDNNNNSYNNHNNNNNTSINKTNNTNKNEAHDSNYYLTCNLCDEIKQFNTFCEYMNHIKSEHPKQMNLGNTKSQMENSIAKAPNAIDVRPESVQRETLAKKKEAKIPNGIVYDLNQYSNDALKSMIKLLIQCKCLWHPGTVSTLVERREAYFFLLAKLKQFKQNASLGDVFGLLRQFVIISQKADKTVLAKSLRPNAKRDRSRMLMNELAFLRNSVQYGSNSENFRCQFCNTFMISQADLWQHMKANHTIPEYYQFAADINVPILSDKKLFENCPNIEMYENPKSRKSADHDNRRLSSSPKRKRARRSHSHCNAKPSPSMLATDDDIIPSSTTPLNFPSSGVNNSNTNSTANSNDSQSTSPLISKDSEYIQRIHTKSTIRRKSSPQNEKAVQQLDVENKSHKKLTDIKIRNKNSQRSRYNVRRNGRNSGIRSIPTGIATSISSYALLKLSQASKLIQKPKSRRTNICNCKSIMQYMDKLAILEETTNNLWAFDYECNSNSFKKYDDKFMETFLKAYRQYPCLWDDTQRNVRRSTPEQLDAIREMTNIYNELMPNKPITTTTKMRSFLRRLHNYYTRYLELRNQTVNKLLPRSNVWEQMSFCKKDDNNAKKTPTINEQKTSKMNNNNNNNKKMETHATIPTTISMIKSKSVTPNIILPKPIRKEKAKTNVRHNNYCKICKRNFKQKTRFTTHMIRKHPLTKCIRCNKTFPNADELMKHIMELHRVDETCPLCPMTPNQDGPVINDGKQLNWRSDDHLSQHFHNFRCTICEKTYHDYRNYRKHFIECKRNGIGKDGGGGGGGSSKVKRTRRRHLLRDDLDISNAEKPVLLYKDGHIVMAQDKLNSSKNFNDSD